MRAITAFIAEVWISSSNWITCTWRYLCCVLWAAAAELLHNFSVIVYGHYFIGLLENESNRMNEPLMECVRVKTRSRKLP
jgi:hypothetical protein